jgi:hypothetical protein
VSGVKFTSESENMKIKFLLLMILTFIPAELVSQGASGKKPAGTAGPQNAPSQAGSPASSGAGSGLPGEVWTLDTLPKSLLLDGYEKKRVVLCYKMHAAFSAPQPFTLEPTQITIACRADKQRKDPDEIKQCAKRDEQNKANPNPVPMEWSPCADMNPSHPLLSDRELIIGIDATEVNNEGLLKPQLKALSLNVTTQQGNARNPAAVRQSQSATEAVDYVYFLPWNDTLQGDTIPTVAISAIYEPPIQGAGWIKSTFYVQGSIVVANPDNGHFYTAITGGVSDANNQPVFPTNTKGTRQDGSVVWEESGSTSSLEASPPTNTDETITLLNLSLPQVHQLSYYNVDAGVLFSTLHNPNFYRVQSAPPNTGNYTTVQDNGNPSVDPVLMFTAYLKALDAENQWHARDLIPGVSVGFSLVNPSTSFYFGGSSEVRRNVQVFAGVNVAKVTALAPAGYVAPTSSTAPTTKQQFGKGFSVGMTLNIGGFISSLFSGKSGGAP